MITSSEANSLSTSKEYIIFLMTDSDPTSGISTSTSLNNLIRNAETTINSGRAAADMIRITVIGINLNPSTVTTTLIIEDLTCF